VVGFDVADCPVEVGPAAEGSVNDKQIVSGWVLSAEGECELYFGFGEALLQGEGELIGFSAAGEPDGIAGVAGGDVGCLGDGGEHAALDGYIRDACRAVTGHESSRE
jgi:hypothetical protein